LYAGPRIALALGFDFRPFQGQNAAVRQRCVGKVIEASNDRLSIPLLIAVIGSFPITVILVFQLAIRRVDGTCR